MKINNFKLFKFNRELESRFSLMLGGVLLSLALFGGVMFLGPILGSEIYQNKAEKEVDQKVARVTFADYIDFDPVVSNLDPVDSNYSVVIPKIGVNSQVLAQVDGEDEAIYLPALKQGLVQAQGSVFPGQKGDNFIFGHSTDFSFNVSRFNALFYNLKELEVGDKVYVFYQGSPSSYQVSSKAIYAANDVSFLDANQIEERLILQTCWPPGTTFKRLVVTAIPVNKLALQRRAGI